MRDTLRDADGEEKDVLLALIKAISTFLAQSDMDKDRKVLSSLPLLPVRLCAPHPLGLACLVHVLTLLLLALALVRAVVPAFGRGLGPCCGVGLGLGRGLGRGLGLSLSLSLSLGSWSWS